MQEPHQTDAEPTDPALDPLARAALQIRPAGGGRSVQEEVEASKVTRSSWLIGIYLLFASLGAGAIGFLGPVGLFMWVVGGGVVLMVVWVIVCALSPAQADRRCPSCGQDGLVRLDPESHRGLRCEVCGWQDESASSFFLAEEEGALEPVVLKERGQERETKA